MLCFTLLCLSRFIGPSLPRFSRPAISLQLVRVSKSYRIIPAAALSTLYIFHRRLSLVTSDLSKGETHTVNTAASHLCSILPSASRS